MTSLLYTLTIRQDMVNVELQQPIALKHIPTNKDLPPGSADQWTKTVVPTLMVFIAGRKDIWSVDEDDAAFALQQIWDYTFGKAIRCQITPRSPIFGLVSALFPFSKL